MAATARLRAKGKHSHAASLVSIPLPSEKLLRALAEALLMKTASTPAVLSLDREEHEPQVVCVAAPIRDSFGKVLAAISVAGSAHRMVEAIEAGELPVLVCRAADQVGAGLGQLPEFQVRAQVHIPETGGTIARIC